MPVSRQHLGEIVGAEGARYADIADQWEDGKKLIKRARQDDGRLESVRHSKVTLLLLVMSAILW